MRKLIFSLMMVPVVGLPTIAVARDCRELRRACEMKDQLGERGQGNCRRYREECQRPQPDCAQLRAACMMKDQLGEQGQGNCRRYRETCR
jgi:hypothetical protein